MALAFVQTVSVTGANVTSVSTAAINTATGNLVHVDIGGTYFDTFSSLADTAGNTFSLSQAAYGINSGGGGHSGSFNRAYYAKNATGNASNVYTATYSAGSYPTLVVIEISGADTSAPLDVGNNGAEVGVGGTSSPSLTSSATAQANEIVIGALWQDVGSILTATMDSNYTSRFNNMVGGSGVSLGMVGTRIVSATGAQTFANTITNNGNAFAMAITTYKQAAAGGSFNPGWASGATKTIGAVF